MNRPTNRTGACLLALLGIVATYLMPITWPDRREATMRSSAVGALFYPALDFQPVHSGLRTFLNFIAPARALALEKTVYAIPTTHAAYVAFNEKKPDGTEVTLICGIARDPQAGCLVRVPELDETIERNQNNNTYTRTHEFNGYYIFQSLDPDHKPANNEDVRYLFLAVAKETGKSVAKSYKVKSSGAVTDIRPTSLFFSGQFLPGDLATFKRVVTELHQKCDSLVKVHASQIDMNVVEPVDGPCTQAFRRQLRNNLHDIIHPSSDPQSGPP